MRMCLRRRAQVCYCRIKDSGGLRGPAPRWSVVLFLRQLGHARLQESLSTSGRGRGEAAGRTRSQLALGSRVRISAEQDGGEFSPGVSSEGGGGNESLNHNISAACCVFPSFPPCRGVGLHHGGLLPVLRELTEKLFKERRPSFRLFQGPSVLGKSPTLSRRASFESSARRRPSPWE